MPKKFKMFNVNCNVKMVGEMVIMLQAIGYYRGNGGEYADPVRDFCQAGVDSFLANLTPAERRRFDEILENVRTGASLKI